MSTPLPNHSCPLCGKPNLCAPARSGDFTSPCWCTEQTINPQAIAKIPLEQRNKACLCQHCANSSNLRSL